MTSGKSQSALRALGVALGFGCLLSAAGCDYWPPALQAQIERHARAALAGLIEGDRHLEVFVPCAC